MKIFLDSIGCRLNQSEIERYARKFREAGHEITMTAEDADIAVINTCAVTSNAAADSRQRIRKIGRAGGAALVLTGCLSTLDPVALRSLPQVINIIPNDAKDDLVEMVLRDKRIKNTHIAENAVGGSLRTRTFIKVQDGCDNQCTYCITRIARGPGRSVPTETVLEEINLALGAGVKEIVLTGVHLGSWGKDMTPRATLKNLIRSILDRTDIQRLRLSSLEPWDLDGEFFRLWEDNRLCPHLHLPLQSGSDAVLRGMARATTAAKYRLLLDQARAVIPELAVTTDIIVGFPGESDTDFAEGLEFVRSLGFAGGHVFSFSPRAGTAAASYPDQVKPAVKKIRSDQMQQVFSDSAIRFRSSMIGSVQNVLWEHSRKKAGDGWLIPGFTENYIHVEALSRENRWNEIGRVKITSVNDRGLTGEILE